MAKTPGLFSLSFLAINVQFALVTAIAAMFFAYSGYLSHLGISPARIGFILSADSLAALVLQPVLAPIVHARVARRCLLVSSIILSFSLFLTGRVGQFPWLLIARLIQGLGFIGVLTALTTMLVQYIPPGRSGAAFGWVSLIRLVPYAVIPPLFDYLAVTPQSFPWALDVAAAAALGSLLLLVVPPSELHAPPTATGAPGFGGLLSSIRSPAVALVLLSVLLFFCGYSAVFFYLKEFGNARGMANVSLFFTIATSVMILVRLAGGCLFDRYPKAGLSAAALALAASGYLAISLPVTQPVFLALAAICGLGWGIAMPLQAALMHDVSNQSDRAMNQNLLLVMMQGGFIVGPLLGAHLITASGYGALFAGLGVLTLAASLAMAVAGRFSARPAG